MPPFTTAHAPRSRAQIAPRALLAASMGAIAASTPSAWSQSTIEWGRPVDGDFAVAGNWLPMVVPGALDTAVLGGLAPYLVTVGGPTPVSSVVLSNPGATLFVRPGGSLTVGAISGTGTIVVNDGASASGAELLVEDGGTIDADIRLQGTGTRRAQIRGLGASHRLGPSAVITADYGSITGPWISEATILKDQPGTLTLGGIDIRGGALRVSGGGVLFIGGATVTGASIEIAPDGRLLTNQNTIVSDSTFVGGFTIRSGQDITFASGVVLTDDLVINEPGSIGEARLFVEEGTELNGPIRIEGSSPGGQIIGLGDAHFLGPDAVITGERGAIVGPWTSQATIINDGPGGFGLSGLSFIGGTLRSSNGGRLDIAGATISNTTIEAGPGGSFRTTRDTNVSDSTIVGDYTLVSGQRLTFGLGVQLQGDLTIGAPRVAAQTQLYAEDGVTLNSPIRLAGSESEIVGLGFSHTLGPDAVVTVEDGRISGTWTNEGTIGFGSATDPIGRLQLSGPNLILAPSSRVRFDIAGAIDDRFDRIESADVVTLDGEIDIGFLDGYDPDPRDRFEIISALFVDGTFGEAVVEPIGAPGPAHVVYTGDAVLVVICAADRDGDGELTLFDFLEFQNQFDAGDLRADLDGDGSLTIFDFLVFQNRFDAGCG